MKIKAVIFWAGLIILVMVIILSQMGRTPWGPSGVPGLCSNDIWSQENSQRLADQYTLTHISHGLGIYALLHLTARALPVGPRLLIAVVLEGGWEVLENTDFIINKYREATISLDYYGDSILNSVGDVIAMILGFLFAAKLSVKKSWLFFIFLELLLALWIKDNLIINIIMLIYPLGIIKAWQLKPL